MKKVVFAFILLFSFSARADIIFIDLHHSAGEVKAAQEAADKRGEKLIVISAEKRKKGDVDNYNHLAAQADALNAKANEMQQLMNRFSSDKASGYSTAKRLRDQYLAEYNAKDKVVSAMYDRIVFDKDDLDRALTKIESEHRRVTSLIISGHSNGSTLWGDEGRITRKDILAVFNKHPSQKASLDSVLLWGCYAGKLGGVNWWHQNFPKVDMLAGFAGAAPLAATEASPDLLRDILVKQAAIENQTDAKGLEQVFSGLKDVSATNASIATQGCYVANVEDVGRFVKNTKSDKNPECAKAEALVLAKAQVFAKYYRATTLEFATARGDPHSSANPLRSVYNYMQTYDYCPGMMDRIQKAIGIPIDTDMVLGMIYFENVRKNYEAYFGIKMGANRKEVLEKLASPGFKNNPHRGDAEKMLLKLGCLPFSWITTLPDGRPEDPDRNCLNE